MSLPPAPDNASAESVRKAQLLARVHRQRAAWKATRPGAQDGPEARAAAAAAPTVAGAAAAVSDVVVAAPVAKGPFPRSVTMRIVLEHPALAAGLLGLAVALGPRRLVRTASMLLPFVLRRY